MPRFAIAFVLLGLASLVCQTNAQTPATIPLYNWITNDGNDANLVIYAAIGSNTYAYPYVFDTGSASFITASGTTSFWTGADFTTPTGTFSIGYSSTLVYKGNTGIGTVTLTDSAGAHPTSIPDATFGIVTQNPDQYPNWTSDINMSPPVAPEAVLTYGTFGAGLFATAPDNGSMSTILGQMTVSGASGLHQGYIVHSGGPTATGAYVKVGIESSDISRFTSLVAMQSSTGTLNTSTTQSVKLYPENQMLGTITLVDKQGDRYTGTVQVLVDSGGQGMHFTFSSGDPGYNYFAVPAEFYDSSTNNLKDGVSFSLSVPGVNSGSGFDWSLTAGSTDFVNQVNTGSTVGTGSFNTGIAMYYNYDVMFDTTQGTIGFEPLNVELNKSTLAYQGSYLFQGFGDFTRFLGTDLNQIQWTGSGGFSAQGGNLTVNIGGSGTPETLKWGETNFLADGQDLYFGSPTSDGSVLFENNLDLDGQSQTILATRGISDSLPSSVISGNITNGSLVVGDALDTGVLVLSGTNTYSGGTTINGGILEFAKIVSMPDSGTVTVNSLATLAVNVGGAGEFTTATSGYGSIGGLLNGLGGQSGSSVDLELGASVGLDTTNAGGSVTYAGDITNSGIGITKLGTGTLILTGSNTYTGGTSIKNGTLEIANEHNIGGNSGGGIRLDGGELVTTTTSTLTENVTLDGTIGVSQSVDTLTGSVTTTYGGEFDTLAAAPGTTATYTGLIADGDSVAGQLIVGDSTNNGTVVLANANTYTGGTVVNGGILQISEETNIGGATGGGITLNGGELVTTATASIVETVSLGSGTNTLAAATGTKATYSGSITDSASGNGGVIIGDATNTGTVVFSGTASYSGDTDVAYGTLQAGVANALSSQSAVTVESGATLDLDGHKATIATLSGSGNVELGSGLNANLTLGSGARTDTTFSGVISGEGGITKVGTDTFTLAGANTYSGITKISLGTLSLGEADAISRSSTIILDGGTLDLNGYSPEAFENSLTVDNNSAISFEVEDTNPVAVAFANSSSVVWTGTLSLLNFTVGTDEINFGDAAGLTTAQLADIVLAGYRAIGLDNSGNVEFALVPEPTISDVLPLAALLMAFSVWRRRRRV